LSINATKWAWLIIRTHDKKPSATARSVFLALAERHNQNTGLCFPSVALIAKDTGLAERTVQKSIRELENLKLLKTRRRKVKGKPRNLPNQYDFLDPFRGARGAPPRVNQMRSNLGIGEAPQFRPSNPFDVVLETEEVGLGK
jgi:hypothetical protein